MKLKIKEFKNYKIENPLIEREPVKNIIMRIMFIIYKKARLFLSKWWSLSAWQDHSWNNDFNIFDKKYNNQATITYFNKKPFFNIETISMLELIPKEEYNNIIKGIERFKHKHIDKNKIHIPRNLNNFTNSFGNYGTYFNIDSFIIKSNSPLKSYISSIVFHIDSISNSFYCLNITVHLNKELKEDLSHFLVNDVKSYSEISGFEDKKWYQFRTLGKRNTSGSVYKNKILNGIITDIMWHVLDNLSRYIKTILIFEQSKEVPICCSISTNIDGNNNHEFWNSVGIDSFSCDFKNNFTSCIAWRDSGAPFYVYLDNMNYNPDDQLSNKLFARDFGSYLCNYLISSQINTVINSTLTKYSSKVSKLKNKSLSKILKINASMHTEMFFFLRFLNEFECNVSTTEFENFYNIYFENKPIIYDLHKNIEKETRQTLKTYTDIEHLYQTNIDYKASKFNYNIQRNTLIITFVSALVAILALFVSLLSFDSFKTILKSLLDWLLNNFN